MIFKYVFSEQVPSHISQIIIKIINKNSNNNNTIYYNYIENINPEPIGSNFNYKKFRHNKKRKILQQNSMKQKQKQKHQNHKKNKMMRKRLKSIIYHRDVSLA